MRNSKRVPSTSLSGFPISALKLFRNRCLSKLTAVVVLLLSSVTHAGYTETRYPIVLVHGLSGFDTVGGLLDYYHTVSWNLERSGAKVYTAQVSAFNHSEERGMQLRDFIVNQVPEAKVNLIGHSQGAPTARVATTLIPERIASVTSIGGVNKGSKVADVIRGIIPPDSGVEGGAVGLLNAFGSLIDLLSSSSLPQNSLAALETLTTPGTADLNSRHGWGVDMTRECGSTGENVNVYGNNVKMFSWVGTSVFTNVFDPTDYALLATSAAFGGEANDGLVSKCSQYLGNVVYNNKNMNHLDEVNQMLGVRSLWLNPISLYRAHANRMKNRGL